MKSAALFALLAAAAAAQTPRPPVTPAPDSGPARLYSNPALHLTFSYPAELQPQDPNATNAAGQRMIFGENAPPSATTPAPCTKTLLAVGTRPSGASSLDASLTLFDIDLRCLPPKAAKSKSIMDETLRGFAAQAVTLLGMMPMGDIHHFLLQGRRAWFAASQGTPVAKTDLQTGQSEIMAAIAVEADGHILAWMFESNDLNFINRMLAGSVDLGVGPSQPLDPVGISPGDSLAPQ